jgi:hypothetical protein
MSWIDALVLLCIGGIAVLQARLEFGQGIWNLAATLAAARLSLALAPGLTAAAHWQPYPESNISPLAHGLCFLGVWGALLLAARLVHRQTRWSLEQYDPLVGVAFGLVIAVVAGHTLIDVSARETLLAHGSLPPVIRNSAVVSELRSFSTVQTLEHVLKTCRNSRSEWM